MKKFFVRLLMITTVLLFGILFGIYQAHSGPLAKYQSDVKEETEVVKVEKKQEQSEKKVEKEDKEVSTNNEELEKKQEHAEAVSSFNFYSELGTTIGDVIQNFFSSLINMIVGTVHSLLHP